MKIAKVVIENFRRIDRLELDFTDSFGRVRPVSVLVGPNGSGKTSVLDAIGASIGATQELPGVRPSLPYETRRMVRRGADFARVTCALRFHEDELSLTRELLRSSSFGPLVSEGAEVSLTWTFPHPEHAGATRGWSDSRPTDAWRLLKGRIMAVRALRAAPPGAAWLRRLGRVITIDQQRTILSRVVSPQAAGTGDAPGPYRTDNPRQILVDLALKHAVPGAPQADDLFARVRDQYNTICAPRLLVGAVQDEDEFDVRFRDGEREYGFDDIASGEAMILLLLITLSAERIHRSIVLIDEVELHQHPLWQRRLLNALPLMGEDNQFIVTTHSDYLLTSLDPGSVQRVDAPKLIELGNLREGDG